MKSLIITTLSFLILLIVGCKKSEVTIEKPISDFNLLGFQSDAIISSLENNFLLVNYNSGNIEMINNFGEPLWAHNNCFQRFNPNKLAYIKNPVKLSFDKSSELGIVESVVEINGLATPKNFIQFTKFDKSGFQTLKKRITLTNELDTITLLNFIFDEQNAIIAYHQSSELHIVKINNAGNEIWHKYQFLSANDVKLAFLNATTFIVLRDQTPNILVEYRNIFDGSITTSKTFSKSIFNSDGSPSSEFFSMIDIKSQLLVTENSISFCGSRDHKINGNEVFSRVFYCRINTQSNFISTNYMSEVSDVECLGGNLAMGNDGKEKIIALLLESSTNFYPIQYNLENIQGALGSSVINTKNKELKNCYPLAITINEDETISMVGKKGTMPEYAPVPYVLKPKFYSQQTFFIRLNQ